MSEWIWFDVEANGFLKEMTKIHVICMCGPDGVVASYADQPGYLPLAEAYARLKKADKVVAHNTWGYDYWAVNKVAPGTIRREQVEDSLMLSRMRWPEASHSLAHIGEQMGYPKMEYTLGFEEFNTTMVEYCEQDVRVLFRWWKEHLADYYWNFQDAVQLENKVTYILEKQRQHGFRIDLKGLQEREAALTDEFKFIHEELQNIFPPIVEKRISEKTGKRLKDKVIEFNPNSGQQVAERLIEKYGWQPEEFTPSGIPKTSEDILGKLDYPEAKMLARAARITKMLGQISHGKNAWLKLEKDGRLHGMVKSCGARTHRMSHAYPNMAQVDKELREYFLPDEGHVLVGADASGLELRLLSHLLARYDGGRYVDIVCDGDVHSENQKAAALSSRDSAKTFIYAMIYGGGAYKIGTIIEDDARKAGDMDFVSVAGATANRGKKAKNTFFKNTPGMKQLMKGIDRAHETRVDKSGTAWFKGIDGRPLANHQKYAALNTVLQSMGAIVMKKALVMFDDWLEQHPCRDHVHYVANVHDEVQFSCKPEYAELVGQSFVECIEMAAEALGIRCPLTGEYKIGNNWKETH